MIFPLDTVTFTKDSLTKQLVTRLCLLAIAIYSIILNMLTNFFDFISNNISYTAAIVCGVSLFNYSFYCLCSKSIPLGFKTIIFGNDILTPLNTSSSLISRSSDASSLISRSSSLSSGSTAMQLTPTVSSSSTSSYLSPQFQFHNYLRTQLIGS